MGRSILKRKIQYPVKNFRFNESPVIMLNNPEELGRVERTVSDESNANYLLPPMKSRDFIHEFIGCRVTPILLLYTKSRAIGDFVVAIRLYKF